EPAQPLRGARRDQGATAIGGLDDHGPPGERRVLWGFPSGGVTSCVAPSLRVLRQFSGGVALWLVVQIESWS
ncbi:hypothetical protein AB0M86_47960, partial [Streptomyces sp. NPDC051639]|uniref:hypothetical protein n=1 Tax=Streptomyces sp. NPDC051639 TaxID=3155671 RepID=UPI0034444B6F